MKFDLRSINVAVKEASLKWRLLGVALGVEYTDLDRIHVDCRSKGVGVDEHLTELLRHWINSDAKASWDTLLDALESMQQLAPLAKKVRNNIFPGEYPALNV